MSTFVSVVGCLFLFFYLVISGCSFGLHSVADPLGIETESPTCLRVDARPIVALVVIFNSIVRMRESKK